MASTDIFPQMSVCAFVTGHGFSSLSRNESSVDEEEGLYPLRRTQVAPGLTQNILKEQSEDSFVFDRQHLSHKAS